MPIAPAPTRFDDRLATMLRIDPQRVGNRATLWRQLTAFLAQSGRRIEPADVARALAALAVLAPEVPLASRVASARAIAARCDHAALAVLLSHDVPAVVVPLFDELALGDDDWLTILPQLSPLARSRLRARADLSERVHRALASLAPTDFALPSAAPAPGEAIDASPPVPVGSPIADLVHRIEAYRARKPSNDTDRADALEPTPFAADADGNIRLAEAGSRAAFVGVSLADVAPPGRPGVDAGTAAAFARRDGITGGRLLTASGALWAIEAKPGFATQDGRFVGYRGTLSRDLGAVAHAADASIAPADRGLAAAMQQMAHELRSPLNAISGFAQLIAGQYFGPVSGRYRDLAASINADAEFLTVAFEDIDLASRLDTGRFVAGQGSTNLASLLPGGGHGDVALAVDDADASRLLRLVRQPDADGSLPAVHVAVGRGSVTLTVERGDGGDTGMALAIAARLADAIGCTLVTGPRKTVVNLPRLSADRHQTDAQQ